MRRCVVAAVTTVLSCAGSIGKVAAAALGEVTGYATQVVTYTVAAGLPAIVQCAAGVLLFNIGGVSGCVDNIVSVLTQFVTITLNRLQALVVQVQNLVAAVDKCMDDATAVMLQAMQAVVDTCRTCLGAVGVII